MNTILLQKILDILTEGLAHVGDFFKDLFVSDPQDGQVIGYDAETGEWKNMDIAELSFDITHTSGPADSITITDAAADMPVTSLTVDIMPQQASGTPSPDNPLPISGTDSIVITHTYGDNETETKTVNLPSTVYGGEVDVVSGQGNITYGFVDLSQVPYTTTSWGGYRFTIDNCKPFANANVATCKASIYATTSYNDLNTNKPNNTIAIASTGNVYLVSDNTPTGLLVFELATPTPITTTHIQIKTQGGTETFAIDANEMELEYYTATAGTIKDLVSITEDITSEVTKNTTDFSDILLKVSQNNKVVSVEIYSATTAAAVNETFLSNLPKPAMNCKVLLVNTTLGEDGIILGTLKTTGELDITTSGAKTFSGLITYVAK